MSESAVKKPLIIIGGGAAGLSAAVRASELGLKVLVLEALPTVGGNGRFAEVMFALNSKVQKAQGITCDLDGYFRLAMQHSHYKDNARLIRAMLEHSAENMDWLCDHGLQITGFQEEGAPGLGRATHHTEGMHTGRDAMKILEQVCRADEKIEIRTKTKVLSLMQDPDGAVVGVVAETEGAVLPYEGCGVLITCGGFSGSSELAGKVIPGIDPEAFAHLRGIRMQGDGVRLAHSAGAEIMADGCFENAGPTFAGDSRVMSLVTKRYALWLNASGRRFADESVGDNFVFGCNAVYAQPGHTCWVLLDAAMVEEACSGPVDFLAGPEAVARGTSGIMEAVEKEIGAGRVFCTDTIEDLAKWMGAPAEILQQEIDEYNSFCRAGRDPVFLKPAELLKPVETPPYVLIRCGVDNILTHGGIRVDEQLRVVKADGRVIPGLYAAGADISGIDSNGYQVSMGGHSLGFSMTGGRIAAEAAAALA